MEAGLAARAFLRLLVHIEDFLADTDRLELRQKLALKVTCDILIKAAHELLAKEVELRYLLSTLLTGWKALSVFLEPHYLDSPHNILDELFVELLSAYQLKFRKI
jgi:hypothetical protein